MTEALLVTGGCGYIGSHTANRLLERGSQVIVVDDLSTGHIEVARFFERVYGPDRFVFEHADILDRAVVEGFLGRHEISGIVDFAAKCLVEESQQDPEAYFKTNVVGFRNLLESTPGIPMVKSSTCAVYGEPSAERIPVSEDYLDIRLNEDPPTLPELLPGTADLETLIEWYGEAIVRNDPGLELSEHDRIRLRLPKSVYGVTKAMDELILEKLSSGRPSTVLRYFNVVGADPSGLLGEDHRPETHLVPLTLDVALGRREEIVIYGDDYETRDGTAVRDYLYVEELAEAHILCLDELLSSSKGHTLNLGTGVGFSVREIVDTVRKVTGHEIPERIDPRRNGDVSSLVAAGERAEKALGWKAVATLENSVETAWNWYRLNPSGYRAVHERRFNPFWNRWINVASSRSDRPWQGERTAMVSPETPVYDPACYLCPGNRRASGETNPDYQGVWSFVNDFPALDQTLYVPDDAAQPYRTAPSHGICEVINYHHDHSRRMSVMESHEIESVVESWAASYERTGKMPGINYVLICENRGTVMGNSMPHPHGQVFGYAEIPDLMVGPQMRANQGLDRQEAGPRCFVCRANEMECRDGRRMLASNETYIAYVPFAAQLPYDIVIAPWGHVPHLIRQPLRERGDLAEILRKILRGLDRLFEGPYHYSLAVVQQPTDGSGLDFHMQLHITSLLRGPGLRKHVVGSDVFGEVINPTDPNHTAAAIRYGMLKASRDETTT